MKPIYISGPPGSGKSTLVQYLSGEGYKTFDELVDRFPVEEYPNPRTFSTAKYIFDQNVKRDQLIRKIDGVVIVDRHPFECVCIAKGLLGDGDNFRKIEKLYLEYEFLQGSIVELFSDKNLFKDRFLSKNVKIITEDMIDDIYIGFGLYSNYLKSDIRLSSTNSVKNNGDEIISYLKTL